MVRERGVITAFAALACLALTSCGLGSRYIGTWTGTVQQNNNGGLLGSVVSAFTQAAIGGQSTLTLERGGKGFLKVGSTAERPLTWTDEGSKLILHVASDDASSRTSAGTRGAGDSVVGTLSPDGETLSLDLGPVKVVLTRQPGS